MVGHTFAECFDAKLYPVKVVYLCQQPLGMRKTESYSEQNTLKKLEKVLLGCATFSLATSNFTQQYLRQFLTYAEIFVALPIVELPNLTKHSESPIETDIIGVTRILCVANFLPGKGQLNLIKELAKLNYKNLDELPELKGQLTTTEFLAKYIHDQIKSIIKINFDCRLKVCLGETHDALASYQG
jgi:glycosyltransferase involved in cell wall biosynthesis